MFVEMFSFKTVQSVIVTQKTSHAYFMLRRNDAVSDRKLILVWVENFIH